MDALVLSYRINQIVDTGSFGDTEVSGPEVSGTEKGHIVRLSSEFPP